MQQYLIESGESRDSPYESQVSLISSIQVDAGEFPLHLPFPNQINSGGYLSTPSSYSYSPIDLLIAGLEANRLNQTVENLVLFFDTHRRMFSDHWVTLATRVVSGIHCLTVAQYKDWIISEKEHRLLSVLRRNAPLTFKWVVL